MTTELFAALVAAQSELSNPPKTKTARVGSYSYTYADLPEIIDHIRPVLARHGLAVLQPVCSSADQVGVKTIVVHTSGQSIESSVLWLPAGETPQQGGSAATYARRYSLCGMLGIAADEDTDAGDLEGQKKRKASVPPSAMGGQSTAGGTTAPNARAKGKGAAAPADPPAVGTTSSVNEPVGPSSDSTDDGPGPGVKLTPPVEGSGEVAAPGSAACLHVRGTKLDRDASRTAGHRVDVCVDCGAVVEVTRTG